MDVKKLVLKKLAEKAGVPEEDIESLANKEDPVLEEISKLAPLLSDLGDAPDEVKQQLGGLMAVTMMKNANKSLADDLRDFAKDILMLKEGLKILRSEDEGGNPELKELSEKLSKLIEELTTAKEEALLQTLEEMRKSLEASYRRLEEALADRERPPTKEEEDFKTKLVNTIQEAKELVEALKEIGLLQERSSGVSLSKLKEYEEELRRLGYEVRPPPTMDQIRRMLEEERRRIQEEAEKKAIEKLKLEEKRTMMLLNVLTSIASGIFDTLKSKSEGGKLMSFAQQLAGRMMLQGQEGEIGGGADTGGGETGTE